MNLPNSGRFVSILSSARLSSGLGSVHESTWLRTPLETQLGSAQIGARFDSVLGGTRGSAWIDVRFGSAQASDQLKTRLEARDSARLCSETQIDISSRGGRAYRALDFQVSIVKSSHLHLLHQMFEMFCYVGEPSKPAAWKWAYVTLIFLTLLATVGI